MSRVVLHGGTVITCNAAGQVGEAVCFDEAEGQIIAVGTQAQVQAAAGDGAREVDVEGATVVPGLIDTHPHLMHFGVLAEPLVDLSNAVDHTDIVTRVAANGPTSSRTSSRAHTRWP
jgi:predicted amidohydrolase YtcJ